MTLPTIVSTTMTSTTTTASALVVVAVVGLLFIADTIERAHAFTSIVVPSSGWGGGAISFAASRFQPPQQQRAVQTRQLFSSSSSNFDHDDTDEPDTNNVVNPYADPNYPDLEFVNYDDPEYADQGDEYYSSSSSSEEEQSSTEEQLEAMREDRRRRNDEFQFQTYWNSVWGAGGTDYKGEWTVYYSSTFLPDDDTVDGDDDTTVDGLPRLIQVSDAPLTVISRAVKEFVETTETSAYPVDAERILHAERLEQPMGDADLAAAGTDAAEHEVLRQTYWPASLQASDFRGHQGIMVCGK
jgi:hypothetical protein